MAATLADAKRIYDAIMTEGYRKASERMSEITTEDVIARAATDYEVKRAVVQAEADGDQQRQVDAQNGVIQKPYVAGWSEISPDTQQWWLREARRKLEAEAREQRREAVVSDEEQVAAYKATLPAVD